jgi:SAM-dependent methyltransferase
MKYYFGDMENNDNEIWLFPIGISEKRFIRILRNLIGKIFLFLNPNLQKAFFNGRHPTSKLERAAIAALVSGLNKSGKQKELAILHKKLWESKDAFPFFKTTEKRFDVIFQNVKNDFDKIFDEIIDKGKVENIVEIGCGSGKLLKYLETTRSGIPKFIGLDINENQIKKNQETFRDSPKLKFYTCDANDWVNYNHLPNTVFLTFGGIFEYFDGDEIRILIKKICDAPSTGIVIYEPLAKGFDPKKDYPSVNFGEELSFSHAYSYLVKEGGMDIFFEKIEESANGQWILMGALK